MDFRKEFKATTTSADFDGKKRIFSFALDALKPFRTVFAGIEWIGGITSAYFEGELEFFRSNESLLILPIERCIDVAPVTPVNKVLFAHPPNAGASTLTQGNGLSLDFVFDGVIPITRHASPAYVQIDADFVTLTANKHVAGAGTSVLYLAVKSSLEPFP